MSKNEEDFETKVLIKLARIEEKLDEYPQVKANACDALNLSRNNAEDIKEMKENNKWIWRTLVGVIITVILNVINFFLKGGK